MGGKIERFNYRFDPFTQTASPFVIAAEAHTVPAGAPHYIQLDEVPNQETPSTVTIPAFTEVATAPGVGEFQVDYQYKTAMIRFNAADAAAGVAVSYKGTGSPNLAHDLGRAWNSAAAVPPVSTASAVFIDDPACVFQITPPVDSVLFATWSGNTLSAGMGFRLTVDGVAGNEQETAAAVNRMPFCTNFIGEVTGGATIWVKGQARTLGGIEDWENRYLWAVAIAI